ncbi:helix-turn-helix domain-containing protein [Robertmurraya sp.]|uniref:helix-turn-helix domain-containing protein n=1 Tax=Robertmurraya sp. TaxID=2837525 RepID=UPI0037040AF6
MKETVGTRLRKRREELGYTQKSLEETAGLSHGVIASFEEDNKYPKNGNVRLLILHDNKADEPYITLGELVQTQEQIEALQRILVVIKKFNSPS